MTKGFQSVGLIWWMTVPFAIIFLFFLSHAPQILPLTYFGVFGGFFYHLVTYYRLLLVIAFWATIVAHVYEAVLARHICQQLRLTQTATQRWMLQTFIIGDYKYALNMTH
jgi:hypothetical protein